MTDEKEIAQTEETTITTGPKWGSLIAWGGLLALLGLLGLGLIRAQRPSVEVGKKAPDFVLTTFDDQQIDSRDLLGKVIVLNFWASWCKPCEQEAAELEQAWRQYQPGGDVVFLGVAWTDTPNKSAEYLEKFDITYPNGPDLGTRISQAFNRKMGVPETYIIDRQGILRSTQIGPYTSLGQIQAAIESVLQQ
jgi:cytochrome c biogenesis protein CcmG/thiol:disulfide interchange protein DsbE